ncbi:unnamed protein product [Schistosoma curassoni]|uniref:SRP9-21 domain-containing protein n=1 Tax=Schistosoma curassoni TaxID=6186 RepID=A0A183K7J8_9TREM|nr:unnamed protein product [Schistosoma curassoni]
MKLKLKMHWKTGKTALQRFNTAFPRDSYNFDEFKKALNKRFQASQLSTERRIYCGGNLKVINDEPTPTCQEVLGRDKHRNKKNISIKTVDEIQERKDKKTATNKSRNSQGTS